MYSQDKAAVDAKEEWFIKHGYGINVIPTSHATYLQFSSCALANH
jgi:hypothetical protein